MVSFPVERRRGIIEWEHPRMPLVRQCGLLGLVRSSLYYRAAGEDEENLQVMRRQGQEANRKRVQRLMRLMELEAIYPKRSLSRAGKEAKHYPYLLRGLEVVRPDQVWAADITYIRLLHGYLYLLAVVDWRSRYVLSLETSNTLDADFCVVALRRALDHVYVERLWRSLKYEEGYLREYESVIEAVEEIEPPRRYI